MYRFNICVISINSYTIHLEARNVVDEAAAPKKGYAHHLPGDWLLPTNLWPVGKIIRDWTLFRLTFTPEGKVDFLAGLLKGELLIAPTSSDRTLVEGKLVPLGGAVYRKGAPGMFKVLSEYRNRP